MPSNFFEITPLVPAGPDLAAALAFYTQQMGFLVEWQDATTAGIRRGGVSLNLVANDSVEWAKNASFSIGVTDLDELHREYRKHPPRPGKIEVKPWGRREFHMIVPSGVCFQFYQVGSG